MSHFTTLSTRITDVEALVAALADVGYKDVEVHEDPQALVGFMGDARHNRANVIIRRRHVGRLSNDIGFLRQPNGRYLAVISDYDRRRHSRAWIHRVTARHAYHLTRRTLTAQGFSVAEENVERDGSVRLVLRRVQ